MPERLPASPEPGHSRLRRIVPTMLLLMLSVLIIKDIFVRRWSAAAPPAPDVTARSR